MDKKIRILVVDDSVLARSFFVKSLQNAGLENVTLSDSGHDALEKIQAAGDEGKQFEIVILDSSMPLLRGIEVVKKCKSQERLKNIHFIMVTAEQDRENVVAALEAGVSDYLVKPFYSDELTKKIERILKAA